MKISENYLKEGYFFALVLALLVGIIYIFTPFLSVIVGAFILVEFFNPVYLKLSKKIGQWPASFITTLLALLTVIIPLILILLFAAAEAVTFGAKIQEFLLSNGLLNSSGQIDLSKFKDILETINFPDEINIRDVVLQVSSQTGQLMYNIISAFISDFSNIIIKGFFMIFTMLYLFVDYRKIGTNLKKISPLPDDLDTIFANKFRSTTRAVIKGTFVIALMQATAVAVVMAMMGLEPIVLWWVIMVILSIIPIGSGLVWFPLGIILFISGRYAEGIFLIIYSGVIINVIDTTFRPRLIKEGTNLHPIVALFSALGGLQVFGLIGLLYGPLIAVFFITIMEIYRKRYQTNS